ncbi:hypothetical protein VKT23_019490 [Stygiomarasmius scandens]|uniref:Uncharacterized protein n=1 Tax=Marasmiellus scandens TaxID=2682957 RepID=A0ABR1IQB1_9AGAR
MLVGHAFPCIIARSFASSCSHSSKILLRQISSSNLRFPSFLTGVSTRQTTSSCGLYQRYSTLREASKKKKNVRNETFQDAHTDLRKRLEGSRGHRKGRKQTITGIEVAAMRMICAVTGGKQLPSVTTLLQKWVELKMPVPEMIVKEYLNKYMEHSRSQLPEVLEIFTPHPDYFPLNTKHVSGILNSTPALSRGSPREALQFVRDLNTALLLRRSALQQSIEGSFWGCLVHTHACFHYLFAAEGMAETQPTSSQPLHSVHHLPADLALAERLLACLYDHLLPYHDSPLDHLESPKIRAEAVRALLEIQQILLTVRAAKRLASQRTPKQFPKTRAEEGSEQDKAELSWLTAWFSARDWEKMWYNPQVVNFRYDRLLMFKWGNEQVFLATVDMWLCERGWQAKALGVQNLTEQSS